MRIYKYYVCALGSVGEFEVDIPKGSALVSAAAQGDDIMVWALADPERGFEQRVIGVYETGKEIANPLDNQHHGPAPKFLNTLHALNGLYVVHVFALNR